MKVPFLDLNAHHQPIREQLDAAISDVIDKNAFAGGPFVAAFEAEFAQYWRDQARYRRRQRHRCPLVKLAGLDVGPGDEVIHRLQHLHGHRGSDHYCERAPKVRRY